MMADQHDDEAPTPFETRLKFYGAALLIILILITLGVL